MNVLPAPLARARRATLTCTMAALCAGAFAAENGTTPAPVPPPPAGIDQAMVDELARQAEAWRNGPAALAAYHFDRGMKARDDNRLGEAVAAFTAAVDLLPENEQYRKALNESKSLAGIARDPRGTAIESAADEVLVRQQQLWNEAQTLIDEGQQQLGAGAFDEAERSFQRAAVRLQAMPYPDQRREPEIRRAETMAQEARARREAKERDEAVVRNQEVQDQQAALRNDALKIERDRIEALLMRAQRARERRDYDDAILLCDQVLKINRAEDRAASLRTKCRRERHAYLRQMLADHWDEQHKLLSERIRSEMVPQTEILRYSTEWPEIDARRTAPIRGLQQDQETWRKAIEDQLDMEVTLDFQENSIDDVVAFLQKITQVNIVLDAKVATANPAPVTLKVQKMKLRHVFDYIMKLTQLKYALRNQAIFISNAQGVAGTAFMKRYDIRDLTLGLTSFPGPKVSLNDISGQDGGGGLVPPVPAAGTPAVSDFAALIQKLVLPETWTAELGNSVEEFNGQLVVTHGAEAHRQVEELLRQLRNQQGTEIHVKCKFLTIENSALEEIGVSWQQFSNPFGGALPSQQPGSDIGAYYKLGADTYSAARLNPLLQGYSTANSLPLPNATEGMTFQAIGWQVSNNLYASAIIRAVEKERRGNVVFEPDLTLFNGQRAHVAHLNQQAYISDYDITGTQYDPVLSVLNYGTVLDVIAVASADKRYITMTLQPTNAQVRGWRRFGTPISNTGGNPWQAGQVDQAGAAIGSLVPLTIPEMNFQTVETTVTIPDGGSLVLAGMTNGESARSHAGVPFLSHIPFLGRLFSANGRQETQLKTLIVVQADVVLFEEIEKKL